MPSANTIRVGGSTLAVAAAAVCLSGCVTTQEVATRARLVDARIRVSQAPLQAGARNPSVRVTSLSELRSANGTAVVAELQNTGARVQTDLPAALALRIHGRSRSINRGANTDYFANHVVAVPPRGSVTWVFTGPRKLPRSGRLSLLVGTSQISEPSLSSLPRLEVRLWGPAGRNISATLANRSSIPQEDVPVYAVATEGGRVRAAGATTLAHLSAGATGRVRLTLIGATSGATVRLTTIPTIFR